jgi:hypothetical protein
VQLGIMDHIDANGRPVGEQCEERLRLTELYGAFAGTPEQALAYLRQQQELAGIGYVAGDLAFGDARRGGPAPDG